MDLSLRTVSIVLTMPSASLATRSRHYLRTVVTMFECEDGSPVDSAPNPYLATIWCLGIGYLGIIRLLYANGITIVARTALPSNQSETQVSNRVPQ